MRTEPHTVVPVAATVLLAAAALSSASAASAAPSLVVMLLLVAPLLEETVFRVGLQDALMRSRHALSPTAAALALALVVALVHVWARQDLLALGVVVPAAAIGLLYNRWRRLRWCVLAHAAMNALWILFTTSTTVS